MKRHPTTTAQQLEAAARRAVVVSSTEFVTLFEKWLRETCRYPQRKLCPKELHPICAANAVVGDLKHDNRYSCQPCWKEYDRARRLTPEYRAHNRAWCRAYFNTPKWQAYFKAKGHAREAKIRGDGGTWTGAEFMALCAKYNHRCLRCGKKRKLTPDHVKPVVNGGRNTIRNLQPLCLSCNCSKGARTIDYRKQPHPNCLKGCKQVSQRGSEKGGKRHERFPIAVRARRVRKTTG